jgi:glycosyltransferase involved in cell wall biosynthesis
MTATFVVVPAYNEAPVLGEVLDDLQRTNPSVRIVVVDDGSTDETSTVASARRVHVLRHVVNLGQGAALRTGFDYALAAGAEIVVTFDADGQMDARDVAAVVEPIALGECDVTFGTRFSQQRPEGLGRARRALLLAALVFTRLTTGLAVTDVHNGFRALHRKALEAASLEQNRMAHASEIVHEVARLRLRWKEVPVRIRYTEYSKRKGQTLSAALDVVLDLLSARR